MPVDQFQIGFAVFHRFQNRRPHDVEIQFRSPGQKAVMTHFVQTSRQHVLQEAMLEFEDVKFHRAISGGINRATHQF